MRMEQQPGWAQLGKTFFIFLVGYFISLIAYYIIPPIMEAILGIFMDGNISILANMSVLAVWVFFMILYPGFKTLDVLRELPESSKNTLLGIIWLVVGFALVYFGYGRITTLASYIEEPILTVIFWGGILIQAIVHLMVVPYTCIIKGSGA